jgi:hypothetical protein
MKEANYTTLVGFLKTDQPNDSIFLAVHPTNCWQMIGRM